MKTASIKKYLPFLLRVVCLLALLPMNILFAKTAYQKLTGRFPSFFFGEGETTSTQENFSAEFENGAAVSIKYGSEQTVLEARADDRLLSIFSTENDLSLFRTNLNDNEENPWFQDTFMIPLGNIAYHDAWFLDLNGDWQFDIMADGEKGDFIRIGDKWETCQLYNNRRTANRADGSIWNWDGKNWSKREGKSENGEENIADR